jgi:hypothetical protein
MSDIITAETTGSAGLAYTLNPYFAFELIEWTLKLDILPTTSESLTVKKNAVAGAVYDVPIYTKDLATLTPTPEIYFSCESEDFCFEAGDTLDFAYDNTDTRTYGLQVKYRRKV